MDKKINKNGFDYVDLGLPSGTLWATCNVGANKPSEYGLYFQWGDTQGYTKEQVGKGEEQKKFASDWNDYKWYLSGSENEDNLTFKKYKAKGEGLELEDDAAHVYMGGNWHMPTPDQIKELTANTTSTWTTQDGVNGRLFTSSNGKSIFIPAAGYAYGGSVYDIGDEADVWASMLDTDDVYYGQYLSFYSDNAGLYSSYRYFGFSVRGVIG